MPKWHPSQPASDRHFKSHPKLNREQRARAQPGTAPICKLWISRQSYPQSAKELWTPYSLDESCFHRPAGVGVGVDYYGGRVEMPVWKDPGRGILKRLKFLRLPGNHQTAKCESVQHFNSL